MQGEAEQIDHPLLQGRREIDQRIAAGDQVDVGEGRILADVVAREHDAAAQLLAELEVVLVPYGEALEQRLRDRLGCRDRVEPTTADRQALLIEIGGEDLELLAEVGWMPQHLAHEHADGVGLLTGGAGRHPHPQTVAGIAAGEQRLQLAAEGGEGIRIAEEGGHRHQQVLQQGLPLAGIGGQQRQVVLQAVHAADRHAALHLAPQRRFLVLREIHAGALLQLGGGAGEQQRRRVVLQAAGPVAAAAEPGAELGAEGGRISHQIHTAQGDRRPRHAIEASAFGCLHQRESAGTAHRPQPAGPIGARAGEHHGHTALPPAGRQRFEQCINRRARSEPRLRRHQAQAVAVEAGIAVRRQHNDLPRLQRGQVGGGDHRQPRAAPEQLHQLAGVLRSEMLSHHIGGSATRRQRAQQLLNRLEPTGRRTDHNHTVEACCTGIHGDLTGWAGAC